jgi:hypothetical protein
MTTTSSTKALCLAGTFLLAAAPLLVGCGKIRVSPASQVRPLRTSVAADDTSSPAARFSALFCATLSTHNPDGGTWGSCETYFKPAAAASTTGSLGSAYRVLAVPGIFGLCVENLAKPFEDAGRHLFDHHGIKIEQVRVSALGSTEHNGKQIAKYLDGEFAGTDKRPYIVLGYSKGASDVLEMLSSDATQRPRVKAVITFAGSIIGSRLPEGVPRDILDKLKGLNVGTCEPGDTGGINSLRRADRAAALPPIPADLKAYSIPAVSEKKTTSEFLLNGWKKLEAYSQEQDSQVIHEDAIVPGGVYLGYARADHWAIALPFEHAKKHYPSTPDAVIRWVNRLVDKNHYPRTALVEAALAYVTADLATGGP